MKAGINYIGVGVGAIILNSKKELFLTKRGKKARNEVGRWEFPGGAVHFGETQKNALKREIHEEFGIEIDVGELFDVNDHLIPDEKQHWVSAVFFAKIKKGKPKIFEPDKCDSIGWFALKKISKLPLSIITRSEVKKLKNDNYF